MLVEDYKSQENNDKLQHATHFLGIRSARDGSSNEAIADWQLTLSDIVDLYNCSPFGKRSGGGLLRVIDILIKLTGMNTDHCAKEKKDAQKMEELKKWAVDQHLGETAMFEKSMEEINELYRKGEKEMIRIAGGDNKWKTLSPVIQAEKYAHMLEKVGADLGKEAFEMLSDHERRTLRLFIWAGCGCHKDLNTVRGGYTAMSQWWEANEYEGPILLANRDNDPVLQEREAAIEGGDTTTLAQDRAFEKTTRGAIKATQIAGAIFNHKDDKKGHHDVFRYWWAEHIGIPFTFPDTSNNRFQSYCDAAAALIFYHDYFLQFLEHLKQNKQNSKLNHMETNLWKALHCKATLTELGVLALYAEAVSYQYI